VTSGRASALVCSTSCERDYWRIIAEESQRSDPLGAAFSKFLTNLGASFVDTPSEPCNECGLTIGHWSRCSHLRDGVYTPRED